MLEILQNINNFVHKLSNEVLPFIEIKNITITYIKKKLT